MVVADLDHELRLQRLPFGAAAEWDVAELVSVVPGERSEVRDPYSAAELKCCGVWVPAFAGTTETISTTSSNPPTSAPALGSSCTAPAPCPAATVEFACRGGSGRR